MPIGGPSVKCAHESNFHVDEAFWELCCRIKDHEATGIKV